MWGKRRFILVLSVEEWGIDVLRRSREVHLQQERSKRSPGKYFMQQSFTIWICWKSEVSV